MGYPRGQIEQKYRKSKKLQEGEPFMEKKRKKSKYMVLKRAISEQKWIKNEESQYERERERETKSSETLVRK